MALIVLTAGIRLITHLKMCAGRKNRNRRRERRSPWHDTPLTSGWRPEEQTLKNGAGQMRVLFTRSCMRSSRCQRSRFPLFEDFYNWRETVSRINASTKGRSSELFNGIIITCWLDITFLSSFHRRLRPRRSLLLPLLSFCLRFVTAHFYIVGVSFDAFYHVVFVNSISNLCASERWKREIRNTRGGEGGSRGVGGWVLCLFTRDSRKSFVRVKFT